MIDFPSPPSNADDFEWLVYADWLEERGELDRVGLIRRQIIGVADAPWSWQWNAGSGVGSGVGSVVGSGVGVGGGGVSGVSGVGVGGVVVGGGTVGIGGRR